MKNLSSLLERFSKSLGKDVLAKEAVITAIFDLSSVELKPEEIMIKEGVLEICSTPGKNNAIRLKEERIIDMLRNERGIKLSKIFYK